MKITKHNILLLFLILMCVPFVYLTNKYSRNFYSNLIKIRFKDTVFIEVNKAYNNHGVFVLNNKYSLSSYTVVLSSTIKFEDPAIRLFNSNKNYQYVPTINAISPPYTLSKNENNDTIKVTKNNDVVLLKLIEID